MSNPRDAILHRATFRLNSLFIPGLVLLAIVLWQDMPARYPVHFDLGGTPTRWEERGPAMWIILVAICLLSTAKLHILQFTVLSDPDSNLVNLPHKQLFQKLPVERRIPVLRRANRMVGLVNSAQLLVFALILVMTWATAHHPEHPAARLANFTLFGTLVLVTVAPILEALAMTRVIRRKLREEGLLPTS